MLETGTRQPESIALYRSAGYRRLPNFGVYRDDVESLCLARGLTAPSGGVAQGTG